MGSDKYILTPHIRWMVRRDLPEVLAIEAAVFEYPWDEETFYKVLKQRNDIGMVVEHDEQVLGYMIYQLMNRQRIHILNFAVLPEFQRRGVGTAMADKLKSKSHPVISLEIQESNLGAQLFFRAMGFRCVSVLEGWYDNGATAYHFRHLKGLANGQTTDRPLARAAEEKDIRTAGKSNADPEEGSSR